MKAGINKVLEFDYPNLSDRAVLLLLLVISLGSLLVSALMSAIGLPWLDGVFQNFGTEIIGAFVTFILFEKIIGARDRRATEQQAFQREIRDLIRRSRSSANDIAKDAVDELRERNLLEGQRGVLSRQRLREANLMEARLVEANLREANLCKADLRSAELGRADLQGADLEYAQLKQANLQQANLSGAKLELAQMDDARLGNADLRRVRMLGAQLRGAELWSVQATQADFREADLDSTDLSGANLQGSNLSQADLRNATLNSADLRGCNLLGVHLSGAKGIDAARFDEKTILPDARIADVTETGTTRYDQYWSPEVDMARYTDPRHVDYWQPVWAAAGFENFRAWTKAGRPGPGAAANKTPYERPEDDLSSSS